MDYELLKDHDKITKIRQVKLIIKIMSISNTQENIIKDDKTQQIYLRFEKNLKTRKKSKNFCTQEFKTIYAYEFHS